MTILKKHKYREPYTFSDSEDSLDSSDNSSCKESYDEE